MADVCQKPCLDTVCFFRVETRLLNFLEQACSLQSAAQVVAQEFIGVAIARTDFKDHVPQ